MSCNCCCTKTLRLCKTTVCGDGVDFGITAQVDGIHKMVLDYLGIEIWVTETFAFGEAIIFPVGSLNENYTFTGKLFDPDGTLIIISKDGIEYDCFKFQTVINVAA